MRQALVQSTTTVAWAWARNCGRALDFLTAEGARFERQTDEEWQWNVLAPFQPLELGQPWRDAGPDRFLTMMWQRFVARGGVTMFGARARRLVFRDGSVRGVVVECGTRVSTIDAHNVLIADGGFQANSEMVREFITPVYRLRAADTGTGDGIAMARALGADVVNMEWFYGHCMTRDALWNNRLWPMFSMYAVIAASFVVDGSGRRFADEGVSNQHMANAISKSATPGNCWVVFDDAVWQTVARAEPLPANPILIDERATIISAGSVHELAALLDMPVGALENTVTTFNDCAEAGCALWPPRTGAARALRTQPIHAVPVITGITFTMGGLRVDANARVRDRDGALIRGLYAAGGAMGGLQGGPKPAYAGGWSEAATFGLLAAEHAATVLQ